MDSPTLSDTSTGIAELQAQLAEIMATDPTITGSEEAPTESTDPEKTVIDMEGLSFPLNTINPKINDIATVGVNFRKEHRPLEGSKDETNLIKGIITNQYERYQFINTSIKDPESLRNNLTLHSRLLATEAVWKSYDMLQPCKILFPDPKTNNIVPILHKTGPRAGKPKYKYLFTDYRTLTVRQVARSCEYYAKYVTFPISKEKRGTFARELSWSYSHFQQHVDPKLYELVNRDFLRFTPAQQAGPLFLKLLLDRLVVNNDASLEALITTTTTYNIKQMSPDENIMDVTALLSNITDTIIGLRDDQQHPLPEKFVQKMMKVFQTTSVPSFNDSFKRLEEQLTFNRRLKKAYQSPTMMDVTERDDEIDKLETDAAQTVVFGGMTFTLNNSPTSAQMLWTMANTTYDELVNDGEWEAAVRPSMEQVNVAIISCWNCGGPHPVSECTEPINQERVDKNRKEFAKLRRKQRAEKAKQNKDDDKDKETKPQKKPPYKWRPPEPHEQGKRIIYDKPYTWNPNHNGWDRDETPESGLVANRTTADAGTTATPSTTTHHQDDDTTIATQHTNIPSHELSQIQLDLANLTQAIARYS